LVPDRDVDRLPAAHGGARAGSGADEGARRQIAQRARHPRGRHRPAEERRRHRRTAGLTGSSVMNSFVTRRAVAVAAAAFLALGAAGAIAQQQPMPQQVVATAEAEISIQSFQFVPAILTIKPGTAVT